MEHEEDLYTSYYEMMEHLAEYEYMLFLEQLDEDLPF